MIIPEHRRYNRDEVYTYGEAAKTIGVPMPTLKSAIHEKRLLPVYGQQVDGLDKGGRRKAYLLKIAIDPLKDKRRLNSAVLVQAYLEAGVIKIPESEMHTNKNEIPVYTLEDFERDVHRAKQLDSLDVLRIVCQAFGNNVEFRISGGVASVI